MKAPAILMSFALVFAFGTAANSEPGTQIRRGNLLKSCRFPSELSLFWREA